MKRNPILIFRSLLVLCITLFTQEAQAGSVNLLGHQIMLPIPPGYCEMGGHPADNELLRLGKESVGNSNELLVAFADCSELKELRNGKRVLLDHFGQILAQKSNGQLANFPGMARPLFLQKMSQRAGSTNEAMKNANTKLRQVTSGYTGFENLGILKVDENGMYVGLVLGMVTPSGQPRSLLGVSALTLIKEMSMSINLYQTYKGAPDLPGLLAAQQSAMAKFVKANN